MKIQDKIKSMQIPIVEERYYAITLTAGNDDRLLWAAQTEWREMTETKPQRELRVVCEVNPECMIQLWHDVGQPCLVVNNIDDFAVFLLLGGNALMQIDIAQNKMPFIIEPMTVASNGLFSTVPIEQVPKEHLQRAPTPKNRMTVLKRDEYRCRICGRRACDYVDVELNVHHILPWEKGGLTERRNLITLCRTCHIGLEPHFEMKLFELVSENLIEVTTGGQMRQELLDGIRNYRRVVQQLLNNRTRELLSKAEKTTDPSSKKAQSESALEILDDLMEEEPSVV